MHARKLPHLEERFIWYSESIETDPASCRGAWLARHGNGCTQLHIDLGCGKGFFATELAKRNPNVLYVGIDNEPVCIALAAQKAHDAQVTNAIFVHGNADDIATMFAHNEIDLIYLNFNAPYPQKKYSPKRLSHASRLNTYRKLLGKNGSIFLKTDSQPYFDYSLDQLAAANYEVTWQTRDYHACATDAIISEFEARLIAKGAVIHALTACPTEPAPAQFDVENVSLVEYLPEDLESIVYAPFGMEDTIRNMINREKNRAEKVAKNKQ